VPYPVVCIVYYGCCGITAILTCFAAGITHSNDRLLYVIVVLYYSIGIQYCGIGDVGRQPLVTTLLITNDMAVTVISSVLTYFPILFHYVTLV